MKKIVFYIVVFLFGACSHKPPTKKPELVEGDLSVIVQIEGIKCCEGVLRLAVYNHKDHWMKESGMIRGRLAFPTSDKETVEIHGLSKGVYAIAIHQDTDGDGRFDRWFGLLPKEPYGFSNNAGKYGPASFKQAAFMLDKNRTLTIKLNSFGG